MTATSVVRRAGRRLKRAVTGSSFGAGAVDGCDALGLFGWATPTHGLVRVTRGDRQLAVASASLPRPDVAASGAGPLDCGFRVPLTMLVEAVLRADDGGAPEPLRVCGPGGELLVTPPLTADDLVSAAALGAARAYGA